MDSVSRERIQQRSDDWREWRPTLEGYPFRLCVSPPALPGLWDLTEEPEVRAHWVEILRGNADYLLKLVESEGTRGQTDAALRAVRIYGRLLDDVAAGARVADFRTVHDLTLWREAILRGLGLYDPYFLTKRAQADRYLGLAHEFGREAWAAGGTDGHLEGLNALLVRLWAGNLFDLGSKSTQEAFRQGRLDPFAAGKEFVSAVSHWLTSLPDAARDLLLSAPRALDQSAEGRVLLFADNAGPDFLLGILPAALYWARRWEVVIVANTHPASSDITYQEARVLLEHLIAIPQSPYALAYDAERLSVVPSGTGSPGIDFRYVGRELNEATEGVSWLLLGGQGRGVETNWATRFATPAFRVAVVKDPLVAAAVNVEAGTPLLRFDAFSESTLPEVS